MNLARLVSNCISRVNPNKNILIMRWKGQSNKTVFEVEYEDPIEIKNVQVQPTSSFVTDHIDGIDSTKIHRSFWIPINSVSGLEIFENKGRDIVIYENFIYNIVHIYDDFQNGWKVIVGAKSKRYESHIIKD